MKLVMCAVKDRATEMFSRPFFFNTRAAAVRALTDEVNRRADDNDYYKHPEDYRLYVLAEYEDTTGAVESYVTPDFVVALETLVKGDVNV